MRDLKPTISQFAEQKQMIVHLVATKLGLEIVPRWASRFAVSGLCFVPLALETAADLKQTPLAAAWWRGSRDLLRDELLVVLRLHLQRYGRKA